jgi:outer membrane protein TolC
LLAAELDLATTDAERIAAYEKRLEKAQAFVQLAEARHKAGHGTIAEVLDAQDVCLEATIGLLKAGGKVKMAAK